jgi:hypothetical protein
MELKGAIEPTFGPYEVYEDEYFNYKAAFEAFITLRDEAESAKLQKFAGELQDIENHLPIDPARRNPKLGALAPIVVVNEIFAAGDANRGVQTAAYNLPNDERVTREKGAKRVMLKNVQDAKFAKTLVDFESCSLRHLSDVSFGAFSHIVMHERYGLGPHTITLNGRQTTVRQEMKDASSFLEEARPTFRDCGRCNISSTRASSKSFERRITTYWRRRFVNPLRRGGAWKRGAAAELPARPGASSCAPTARWRGPRQDQNRCGRADHRIMNIRPTATTRRPLPSTSALGSFDRRCRPCSTSWQTCHRHRAASRQRRN